MICIIILCIFIPFKKFKGWPHAVQAEFKRWPLKVKSQCFKGPRVAQYTDYAMAG